MIETDILAKAPAYLEEALSGCRTFKVETKRADKKFPLTSPQISAQVGGAILSRFPRLKVDVHEPDLTVMVEIRENGAYVHGGFAAYR